MEIRDLRRIVVLADCGTFSEAAEKLYVSRQIVAKTARQFEALAGTRIFDRREGRLVPTERGQDLIADARNVLKSFDGFCTTHLPALAAENLSDANAASRRALVSVALVTGGSIGLPESFFEDLMALDEHTSLSVEEMNSDAVLEATSVGDADIGILGTHPDLIAGFDALLLCPVGVWVMLPDGHPLQNREHLEIADLDGLRMVTAGRHNHLHRWVMDRCAEADVHPELLAHATEGHMIIQMATEANAACFAFPPSLRPTPDGFIAKEVLVDGSRDFGTYAIRRREDQHVPASQRIWNTIARTSRA